MEEISKKKFTFNRKHKKSEHCYWILHIRIRLSTNFQLELTVAIFWPNLPKRVARYSQSKTDKIRTTIEFCIFELVFESNFILKNGPHFSKKDMVKNRESEHHHWIPCTRISLGTKFRLKLTILFFWLDFPQKVFSGLKQKKWPPYIFYVILHVQISLLQNLSSNWQFLFFGSILHKKVFPV